VNAWWRCFPDCRIPINMKLPVLTEEVKDEVRQGVKVVTCTPGTVLLSCGLDNVKTSGPWDPERYAMDVDFEISVNLQISTTIIFNRPTVVKMLKFNCLLITVFNNLPHTPSVDVQGHLKCYLHVSLHLTLCVVYVRCTSCVSTVFCYTRYSTRRTVNYLSEQYLDFCGRC